MPLLEESEKYRLQMLTDAGDRRARARSSSPTRSYAYTAAQQIADFGSTQRAVRLRVAQYGAAYGGYGTPLEEIFHMRSAS